MLAVRRHRMRKKKKGQYAIRGRPPFRRSALICVLSSLHFHVFRGLISKSPAPAAFPSVNSESSVVKTVFSPGNASSPSAPALHNLGAGGLIGEFAVQIPIPQSDCKILHFYPTHPISSRSHPSLSPQLLHGQSPGTFPNCCSSKLEFRPIQPRRIGCGSEPRAPAGRSANESEMHGQAPRRARGHRIAPSFLMLDTAIPDAMHKHP